MKSNRNNGVVGFIGLLLCLPMLGLASGRIYTNVVFDINCVDRIKRAADANTVELAKTELEAVVAYLEKTDRTQGYTSVLWKTPSEDVGFWFNNLKTSLEELKALPATASPLEKSNMLLKLRETLIDHNKNGDEVTMPDGVSRFPNNMLWFVLGVVFGFLGVIGSFCLYGFFIKV